MSDNRYDDLTERLESLPDIATAAGGPNTSAIRARADQRRGRKRIAASAAVVAVLAGGSVAALSVFAENSPVVIEAASDTDTTLAPNTTLTSDTTPASETTGPPDAAATENAVDADQASTTTAPEDNLEPDPAVATTAPAETGDAEALSTTTAPPLVVGAGEVADNLGGKLVAGEDEILHFRADGSVVSILEQRFFEDRSAQMWFHDIAMIDGTPHLTFSTFTAFDFEQSIFETTIEIIDLESDQLTVVERRRIEGTYNDNWIYNDHVTTDGTNIRVSRELWQGHCYFTETLTPSGELVAAAEPFTKPLWLDGIDPATAERWQLNWALIPAEDCFDLEEWDTIGGGIAVLGVNADTEALTSIAQSVN